MSRLEPMIESKKMDIIYNQGESNEFHAIKSVDLEIYPGEFVALFGASGSGKSTLLYNFLGVLPYQAGTLKVAGKDPYELPPMDMVHFLRETDYSLEGSDDKFLSISRRAKLGVNIN